MLDNIVKFLAGLAPFLAIILIIWGAFLVITAGGSSDRLSSGKKVIQAAVVGLAIVLGAWVIVSTVFLIITGGNRFYGAPLPWHSIRCTQLNTPSKPRSQSLGPGRHGDVSSAQEAREFGYSEEHIRMIYPEE